MRPPTNGPSKAAAAPSLGAALQSLFQSLHVPRCPPLCLPLRDERDEQPADPVTPKVELVRDARSRPLRHRLKRTPPGCVRLLSMSVHRSVTRGYGRSAESYERSRPSYPADAVAWLAERIRLGPGTT